MSMIFKFRLLSDEDEEFLRDYEVPYDITLLDFHIFINQELGYDPNELASFFKSDVEWEKLQEFTIVDMGTEGVDIDPDDDIAPPVPMSEVKLSLIMTQKFDRLLYVYDILLERALYVELIESKFRDPDVQYPRIVASESVPPVQCGDIFADAMSEYEGITGGEDE